MTEAVRYVRSRFAGVPLVLGGHSAGAHLAVMAYYRLLLANDAAGVAGRAAPPSGRLERQSAQCAQRAGFVV